MLRIEMPCLWAWEKKRRREHSIAEEKNPRTKNLEISITTIDSWALGFVSISKNNLKCTIGTLLSLLLLCCLFVLFLAERRPTESNERRQTSTWKMKQTSETRGEEVEERRQTMTLLAGIFLVVSTLWCAALSPGRTMSKQREKWKWNYLYSKTEWITNERRKKVLRRLLRLSFLLSCGFVWLFIFVWKMDEVDFDFAKFCRGGSSSSSRREEAQRFDFDEFCRDDGRAAPSPGILAKDVKFVCSKIRGLLMDCVRVLPSMTSDKCGVIATGHLERVESRLDKLVNEMQRRRETWNISMIVHRLYEK